MIRFTVSILFIFASGYCHPAAEDPANRHSYTWISLENMGIDKNNPPAGWSSKASHELLVNELSKRKGDFRFDLLREEFFYMSTGSPGEEFVHLYPEDNINKEYHATAYAIKSLLLKVTRTQQVSAIILSALLKASKEELRNSMAVLFASIEQSAKEDPALYSEYVALKQEAQKRMASLTKPKVLHYETPDTSDASAKLIAQAMNTPQAKKFRVNLKFANETQKSTCSSEKNFQLARAVLELAKTPQKGALVQSKYDEALTEAAQAAKDIDPSNYAAYYEYVHSDAINAIIMQKVSEKFEKSPELSSDVEAQKKIVANFDN